MIKTKMKIPKFKTSNIDFDELCDITYVDTLLKQFKWVVTRIETMIGI